MKELKELEAHLVTCDKYTKALTSKVLTLLGKQMISEQRKSAHFQDDANYWYNKSMRYSQRNYDFLRKNIFMRIYLAIRKEV